MTYLVKANQLEEGCFHFILKTPDLTFICKPFSRTFKVPLRQSLDKSYRGVDLVNPYE